MSTFARRLLWLWCVSLPAQQPAGPAPTLHRDVQQLLARETRDAALTRILARGLYRGPGDYTEDTNAARVGHVVMCPQPSGLPMFAVFLHGQRDQTEHAPRGHLIQVAADGAVVRCWRGNNVLDEDEVLADINGDGVVERIGTMNCGIAAGGTVRELFVVPLTEDMSASLRVAMDYRATLLVELQTTFRVVPHGPGEPARIQVGARDPATGEMTKVIAEWRWHTDRRAWVGPGGGPDQPFVRLPPEGWPGLEEFAAAQRERQDR